MVEKFTRKPVIFPQALNPTTIISAPETVMLCSKDMKTF